MTATSFVPRVRALIVDDEEPARELLRAFLADWPNVEIVGEAGDGEAAVDAVRRHRPDLMFLDVQMPEMNGFDVVAALSAEETPVIVFVTAYDRYALRAFEVSACDYLLKPFDADRLGATVRRVLARSERTAQEVSAAIRALVGAHRPAEDSQVIVKTDGRHVFLAPSDIAWIEVVGKEVRVHAGTTITVREPLTSLAQRLDAARFLRVHRSAIVNRSHIREVQPWFKGDYVIILRNGTRVMTGRSYRSAVQELLNGGA
jgi:two-component system, LytTR family, response regulator